jgi:hypothetical protein
MADCATHLATASVLGLAYGSAGVLGGHFDWTHAALAGGLTALGGLLPDLDSNSGVPLRELASVAGVAVPLLLLQRLLALGLNMEQVLVLCGILYLVIRYGGAAVFRRLTVHRGMFHSIPAMLLAGLAVYHLHTSDSSGARHFLAGGVMIGFLSHLVLDELYSVDLSGSAVRLNKFAGSALKVFSPSWTANATTYGLLALGGREYLATPPTVPPPPPLPAHLGQSPAPSTVPSWVPIPTVPKTEPPVRQVIRPTSLR